MGRSILKLSKAVSNSMFYFSTGCLIQVKKTSLPYYLLKAGLRTDGFVPFFRLLAQISSSPVRTQITNSISYDENNYPNRANQHYRIAVELLFANSFR